MDRVAHADSLHTVYESALACLHETLGVERAAALLFDEQGVMRFVAATGLSEHYKAAVEGHSPWARDETDASPVLVPDSLADAELAPYADLFAREGIRALAFVPLRFGSKLLGKFMLYYAEPHDFSCEEITIAQTVAGHVSFALEHHRIAAALEQQLEAQRTARCDAEREAGLREERERHLHLALQAGEMGTWEWELASDTVRWSEELEAIHGLSPGSFGGTLADFELDIHPADRSRVREAIAEVVSGSDSGYEIEYRIVIPDGSVRHVAAKGRLLRDREGAAVRMIGICSDVTARKRVERVRAFLGDVSRIFATTLAPDEIVQHLVRVVVPRFADWAVVFGLEGTRLVPLEIAHADAAKIEQAWRIAKRWRRPAPGGALAITAEEGRSMLVPHIESARLMANAEDAEHARMLDALGLESAITVPLRARGRTLGVLLLLTAESRRVFAAADLEFVEEIASWAALALDNAQLYAQQETARAAAERSREQLQMLAELSNDLAASLDPDLALRQLAMHVTRKVADYCVTYAYDGKSIRRLGFAHHDPGKRALVEALDAAGPPHIDDSVGAGAVIRTGHDIFVEEVTEEMIEQSAISAGYRDAVMALQPRSTIVVPLSARGATLGAIAFVTTADSERRYDAEDLKLAHEIAARAALLVDNARLFMRAQSAIKARDDMLAVVSHDLRNPLQSISMAAALMERAPAEAQRLKSLRTITLATTQVDHLLQDLLDITRIEADQLSIRPESSNVALLLAEAQTLFESQATERGIHFESTIPPGLPNVHVDRSRILQVLGNLLGNALKFTPKGGRISLSAGLAGSNIRIAVADTGPGVPETHRERIFERFWKGDERASNGAGLGLAVAKGLIEAHDGVIGVESVLGQGSTFFFELPREAVVERAGATPASSRRKAPAPDAGPSARLPAERLDRRGTAPDPRAAQKL